MMTTIRAKQDFIEMVLQGITTAPAIKPADKTALRTWARDVLSKNKSPLDLELSAKSLLGRIQVRSAAGATLRFRTQATESKAALIKAIFDKSFPCNTNSIIATAERIDPKQGLFYSPWKQYVFVNCTKNAAGFLNNVIVKIVASIVVAFARVAALYLLYQTSVFILTARVIPFVINNAPLSLIRLGNKMADIVETVFHHKYSIFIYALGAQYCLQYLIHRLPNIPYVSPLVRRLDVWKMGSVLLHAPQTLSGFIWTESLKNIRAGWDASTHLSACLSNYSIQTEQERINICHKKASEAWTSIFTAAAAA